MKKKGKVPEKEKVRPEVVKIIPLIKKCKENVAGNAIQQVTDVEAKAFTLGKPGIGNSTSDVKGVVKDVVGWCKIKEKE